MQLNEEQVAEEGVNHRRKKLLQTSLLTSLTTQAPNHNYSLYTHTHARTHAHTHTPNWTTTKTVGDTCIGEKHYRTVPKKAKVTELIDYLPVALTSVIMKCFERQVKDRFTSTLPDTLDPLQFAYRPNGSTDNAITITLYTALPIWTRGIPM
jgi:hypothetical protein